MTTMRSTALASRFTLTDTALIEEAGDVRFIYGRWNRIFGSWKCTIGRPAQFELPRWPLLDETGALALRAPDPNEGVDLSDDWTALPDETWLALYLREITSLPEAPDGQSEAMAGWEAYVADIPPPVRRRAAPFNTFQWIALEAMASMPDLIASFLQRDSRQFAMICFAFSGVATQPKPERLALYRSIAWENRRALLSRLVGLPVTRSEQQLLAKIHKDQIEEQLLRDLLAATQDKTVRTTLAELTLIDRTAIDSARSLPPDLRTYGLLSSIVDEWDLAQIRECLDLLKLVPEGSRRQAMRDYLAKSARQIRPRSDVGTIVERWTQRLMRTIPFPPPPIPTRPPLHPLDSVAAIHAEALEMDNCIGQDRYIERVVQARSYLLSWRGNERATVEIRSDGGRWFVGEMAGVRNAPFTDATRCEVAVTFGDAVDMSAGWFWRRRAGG